MTVKQITAEQAHDKLRDDPQTVYIDVRTEQEFQNGHVPGAVNIPVLFPNPATRQMAPNPDFVPLVEAHFPKDKTIILGCQAGGRSQFAAELLNQSGFNDVSNMQGGFGGLRDPMGRVIAPGWAQLNLPIETAAEPERTYEGVKNKPRK